MAERETGPQSGESDLRQQRWELLDHVHDLLTVPLITLAFAWIFLLILDYTIGLNSLLRNVVYAIWGVFVLDFLLELLIAPHRGAYLRRHWLTAISLLLPALGILRFVTIARLAVAASALRSLSLVRIIASLNRGMSATRTLLGANTIGYVLALTVIVTLVGAAGMYSFENPSALARTGNVQVAQAGQGLHNYGEAVWWTAMAMTTMGSDYFPKTVEGRVLGWLLAVYAFAIFGVITGAVASLLLGQGSKRERERASNVEFELAAVREQLALLTARLEKQDTP